MASSDTVAKRSRFRTDAASGEHPYGDLGQVICSVVFLALWILDSFIFRLSTFLAQDVPFYIRWTAAGAVFVPAIYLIRNGHLVISNKSFHDGRVIKDGAFARVRHPLYCGSLLFYGGLFLSSLSLIALGTLAGIFLFYEFIAGYEEKLLIQKYGLEYQEYRKKVPKWIPRIR